MSKKIKFLVFFLVPIIPEYLFELDHPNQAAEINAILKLKNLSSLSTVSNYSSKFKNPSLDYNTKAGGFI